MNKTSHHVYQYAQAVEIEAPRRLLREPDAAFPIGESPDGLPLVLHVQREIRVRPSVLGLLHKVGEIPDSVHKALGALDEAVRATTLGLGLRKHDNKSFYQSGGTVASMLGTTLFDRMLGAQSPMHLPEEGKQATAAQERFEHSVLFNLQDLAAAEGAASAASAASAAELSAPKATTGGQARLRVDLESGQVLAAAVIHGDEREPPATRTVTHESLLALRSARYFIKDRDGGTAEGRLSDSKDYKKALGSARELGWSVARVDVGWLLFELARSVDRVWHSRERVHGDLKPANVLLRKDGIDAFDALDVASGELSLGLTASWAAPEQILARAVTPATDVFALALMTVSLLGASIYGEERTMIVPARGSSRRRIRMITDPEVWLDPTELGWPAVARVAWREFLMQCLAQDPARRPPRGEAFAARLGELLRRWELPGRLQVACGPGQLHLLLDSKSPVWVLTDSP